MFEYRRSLAAFHQPDFTADTGLIAGFIFYISVFDQFTQMFVVRGFGIDFGHLHQLTTKYSKALSKLAGTPLKIKRGEK